MDISKLAKLNPSVICEVMNEDGNMARYNDLIPFAKTQIKIAKIEDLISHRLNERLIKCINKKLN